MEDQAKAELEEFYRTNAQFQKRVLESPNIELDNGEDFEADLIQLNKQFLDTCVQNLKDVGTDCSLSPIACGYMRYTIELLGGAAVREGEEPAEFFIDLGTALHQLIDTYYMIFFKMEQQNRDGNVFNKTVSSLSLTPSPNPAMDFGTSPATSPINGLPDAQTNPLLALQAIGDQKLAQSKGLETKPQVSRFEPFSPQGIQQPIIAKNGNVAALAGRSSFTSSTTTTNSFQMKSAGSSPSTSMTSASTSTFTGPGFFTPSPTPATTSSSNIFSILPPRTLTSSLGPADFTSKSSNQIVPENFSFKPTDSGFKFSSEPPRVSPSVAPPVVKPPVSDGSFFSFKSGDTSTPKAGTGMSSGSGFNPPVTSNGSIFGSGSGLSVPTFNTTGTGLFSGLASSSGLNPFLTPSTSSAASAAPATTSKPEEPDEDEAKEKEAQSHEFTPVVEEDALFSIKSKIFEWNSTKSAYDVRGVGMLHIRKLENQSYQLIVRADNALGNVLLNMKLAAEIPIAIEKNNLKTIDPHKSPPQRILIRVRLATEAQTLLDKINQFIGNTAADS